MVDFQFLWPHHEVQMGRGLKHPCSANQVPNLHQTSEMVLTPEKTRRPDKWDNFDAHLNRFDHMIRQQDQPAAPEQSNPSTPRRNSGQSHPATPISNCQEPAVSGRGNMFSIEDVKTLLQAAMLCFPNEFHSPYVSDDLTMILGLENLARVPLIMLLLEPQFAMKSGSLNENHGFEVL